jgi:YNFM family putative membrane transporter
MAAVALALFRLPHEGGPNKAGLEERPGFLTLLSRWDLIRVYAVGFGAFFVFSSIFNYLPFHLAGPPFRTPTQWITLLYLSYIVGIFTGPLAGRLSDRWGNGAAMVFGAVLFALAMAATLIPSFWAVAASLIGLCAGFFTVHAAASGSLNRKLSSSRGRANSLYVLFYYLGGYTGITLSGQCYVRGGWLWVVLLGWIVLLIPFLAGFAEMRGERQPAPDRSDAFLQSG